MSAQTEDIVSKLSEEQIVHLLKEYGAEEDKSTDQHIWFSTVCHGGDSHKLCYFRDTKTFRCYTHCGSMDIFTMVQHLRQCSFKAAVAFLTRLTGSRVGFIGERSEVAQKAAEELTRACYARRHTVADKHIVIPSVDSNILSYFDPQTFYTGWNQEGIDPAVMRQFGIAWDEQNLSIIIPHRDAQGNLIGIRRRATNTNAGAKYMPLMFNGHIYTHPLGANLYGLYEHTEAIRMSRQVIIFEGEKSVLKHHTMYGDKSNSVAVCGFHITPQQRDLILKLNAEEVILGFDKETSMYGEATRTESYKHYCESINNMGRMFTPYCKVYALVDDGDRLQLKDSPVDRGKEVFEELFRNRQLIIN